MDECLVDVGALVVLSFVDVGVVEVVGAASEVVGVSLSTFWGTAMELDVCVVWCVVVGVSEEDEEVKSEEEETNEEEVDTTEDEITDEEVGATEELERVMQRLELRLRDRLTGATTVGSGSGMGMAARWATAR